MKIVLIPCAATEWHDEGRLLGRVDLPATVSGDAACTRWAEPLRALNLVQIYHSPDPLATHTARLLGRLLAVPVKSARQLAEVDLGLWTGLTDDELKARYASAHRELCDAPLNVNPPGGEGLGQAASRLKEFFVKQLKRNGQTAIGVVVRPVSFAMARFGLEGRSLCEVWEAALQASAPVVVDLSNGREPFQAVAPPEEA